MKRRMGELVAGFDPSSVQSVFSTKDNRQVQDRYFLASANRISFFFEEMAFGSDGQLLRPKELSLNKAGHALHDIDPVFRAFSRSPKVTALLRSLEYKRPLPVQSMYIFKQASRPRGVRLEST